MRVSPALPGAIACIILLLLALCAASAAAAPGGPPRKIKMSEVTSLILRSDMYTTGRRSAPVKQSVCVEGPCQYAPLSTLCKNSGFDGSDAVWACEAELPNEVRFGEIAVNCEGFDYPDDPYILEGSCGLEYQLRAVGQLPDEEGPPRVYPTQSQAPPEPRGVPKGRAKVQIGSMEPTDDIIVTIVAWIIVIAILCCVACLACYGIISGDDRPSSSRTIVYSRNSSSSSSSSSGSSTSTAFGGTKRR